MSTNQSNTPECDDCGTEADGQFGYGDFKAVECPDCGDKWVIE